MAGYIPLPAYQVPRNAVLDFSGLDSGLNALNQRRMDDLNRSERMDERQYDRGRNALMDARRAEETAYSRSRDAIGDQRYADNTEYTRGRQGVLDQRASTEFQQSQQDRSRERFQSQVKAFAGYTRDNILTETDPAIRAQKWQQLLSHPDLADAPEIYRDPMRGPEMFVSQASGHTTDKQPSNVQEYEYFKALPPDQQQRYLTMKRADKWLDAGTTFKSPNTVDPAAQPREIPKDVAEEARQKELGKGMGEGFNALPKARAALQAFDLKNKIVSDDIDRALSQAGPWTTGFAGQLTQFVGSSPAHDLSRTLMSIQSNLGFDELQQMRANSPTGGALGAVTERELALLQATWGSLEQSQSEEQFRYNLTRLKQIRQEFAALKQQAYEADVARYGAAAVPNPAGQAPGAAPATAAPDAYKSKYGLE